MSRYIHCDECGTTAPQANGTHPHGHLPDGWLRFEIHRSSQRRIAWLQLINGAELCSLDCALKRVQRMHDEAQESDSRRLPSPVGQPPA